MWDAVNDEQVATEIFTKDQELLFHFYGVITYYNSPNTPIINFEQSSASLRELKEKMISLSLNTEYFGVIRFIKSQNS